MKRLTAVFLQQLNNYVPGKEQDILACMRRELQRQLDVVLPDVSAPGTLFCSARGKQLQRDLNNWKRQVAGLLHVSQAVTCLDQLETLCREAEQLRQETRQEIRCEGGVDPARLHLFCGAEQAQALAVVDELIRVELYCVAVLGGAELFGRIPPVDRVAHTLSDRLDYYKKYVVSALSGVEDNKAYGVWAFVQQDEIRAGPLGSLAAFLPCSPDKSAVDLLPGECRSGMTSRGVVFQGVGCVTNLNPNNIEMAQHEKVESTIPVQELARRLDTWDPIRALKECYVARPYAVDACELFAVASMAQSARVLLRRGQLGQCFLCGRTVRGGVPLCAQCVTKVKVE